MSFAETSTNKRLSRDTFFDNLNSRGSEKIPVRSLATEPVRPKGYILLNIIDDCIYYSDGLAWNKISAVGPLGCLEDSDGDTSVCVDDGTDDDTIVFTTVGTERARILPTGNVEIDTDLDLTTISPTTGRLLMGGTVVMRLLVSNFFTGQSAGNATLTGSNNLAVGDSSGSSLTSGSGNVFLGDMAGGSVDIGGSNTLLGRQTGNALTSGSANTMVGRDAGELATTGDSNAFFGTDAGAIVTTGEGNTLVGRNSGSLLTTGDDNVLLGRNSGMAATFVPAVSGADSDLLRIQNDVECLISGDFSVSSLGLHGDTSVNGFIDTTGTYRVSGTQVVTAQQGAITALTDSSGGADAGAGGVISLITNAANVGSADIVPTQNAIATLAGQVERCLAALRTHGLIA